MTTMPEVEPFEARNLPESYTDEQVDALRDICTAIAGFPYQGDHANAVMWTVTWLQTRPDICKTLGLGSER